jgi:hypothetical protein
MPQDHTWQRGSKLQQSTLSVGDYQALVWYQTTGEWAALIRRDHTAINSDLFATLIDAQVWCEDRLAELQAQDNQ